MRKLLTIILGLTLAASLSFSQGKIGGGAKVGGTVKATVTSGATFNAQAGSFATNTTTGNQAVTGVGFQPKVVLFSYNRKLADGAGADGLIGLGMAVSSTSRRAWGFLSTDASASSANNAWNRNDRCVYVGGAIITADFVSHDSDGFTINITANTPGDAMIVNYLALGGAALTNVAIGTIAAKTTTGNEAYTGVGFQPTALLISAGKWSTDTLDTVTNGAFTFGFAVSSTARGVVGERSRNGSNPQVSRHRQSTTRIATSLTDAGVFTEADFVSFDSDGFTLNYTTAGGSADIAYYLALRGPSVAVGALNQPGSTGNQTVSGLGFTPKALILASANNTSANNDATNNDGQVSIGWATGSTARASLWAGDLTAVSPTQADKDLDRTKIIKMFSPGTPTLNAAADLDSFGSGQFVLNWTTVDATARQVLYFALG